MVEEMTDKSDENILGLEPVDEDLNKDQKNARGSRKKPITGKTNANAKFGEMNPFKILNEFFTGGLGNMNLNFDNLPGFEADSEDENSFALEGNNTGEVEERTIKALGLRHSYRVKERQETPPYKKVLQLHLDLRSELQDQYTHKSITNLAIKLYRSNLALSFNLPNAIIKGTLKRHELLNNTVIVSGYELNQNNILIITFLI